MWTSDQECSRELPAQVDRLVTWLRSTLAAPNWSGVSFVEGFWLEPKVAFLARDSVIVSYAARFADLMSAGYSWINFHAAGVLAGRLLVSVELPPSGPTGAPRTSVQLSGPFEFARSRQGWNLDELVALR
jgi:hypothetical protein